MTAYYGDNDPYCAEWLRNLIAAGHITAGDVDERPIQEVSPDDVQGYDRCHFFAGVAGWDLALQLAGWEGPVWTGSCPCQPFSQAGKRQGEADARHLWPAFYRLVAERRPATVFGEQVAGNNGLRWLSGIRTDLEGSGYAVGAANLPAACVGAPHVRPRIWWVADANRVDGAQRVGILEDEPQKVPGRDRGQVHGVWMDAARPPPGVDNGAPPEMDAVRAIGNAIVPQVAAVFVRAFMECRP